MLKAADQQVAVLSQSITKQQNDQEGNFCRSFIFGRFFASDYLSHPLLTQITCGFPVAAQFQQKLAAGKASTATSKQTAAIIDRAVAVTTGRCARYRLVGFCCYSFIAD